MIDESKAILEVAAALYHSGKESGNQYHCRSAVSRAYYSVYLFARSIAGMERDQTHWGVIQHFENETRRLNRYREVVSQMKLLKELRVEADYEFPSTNIKCENWETCADSAVTKAGFALDKLQTMQIRKK